MTEQITHSSSNHTSAQVMKRMSAKDYLNFEEAREFARSLNLKTRKDWRSYVKGVSLANRPKPMDIPAHPDGIYKLKGWQGWKNWLGTAEDEMSQYKN